MYEYCISYFFCFCNKNSWQNQLKEGRKGYSGSQPITTGKTWQQEYERPGPRESIVRSLRVMNAGSQLVCLFSPFFQCRMVLPHSRQVFLITPLHKTQPKVCHTNALGASYSSYADNQYCPSQTYALLTWHHIPHFNTPLLTASVSFCHQSTCCLSVHSLSATLLVLLSN